jgi:hypothetical protein
MYYILGDEYILQICKLVYIKNTRHSKCRVVVRGHCTAQGDAGHPGYQGGGQEVKKWKKGLRRRGIRAR